MVCIAVGVGLIVGHMGNENRLGRDWSTGRGLWLAITSMVILGCTTLASGIWAGHEEWEYEELLH